MLLAGLIPAAVFGLEIYIAPLLYVDETAERSRGTKNAQADLLAALWSAETGAALQFRPLKNSRINPPESLFEAVSVCRDEGIEYLAYGYVTRRAHAVQMELRLFDYSGREVMQSFFGMDDIDHYDRLISEVGMKVLAYAGEAFKLDAVIGKTETTRIAIPIMAGYWTAVNGGWTEALLGTAAAGSGLAFVPTDKLFTISGMRFYLSLGLDVKYRLGIGNPARYEAYNQTIFVTTPVALHMALKPRHEVFTGLGYTYFLEIFSMFDRFDDRKIYVYNNMGMLISFGYDFAMGRAISLFFRNDVDFLFNERSLITYAPMIGLNIQVYAKEIKKR